MDSQAYLFHVSQLGFHLKASSIILPYILVRLYRVILMSNVTVLILIGPQCMGKLVITIITSPLL